MIHQTYFVSVNEAIRAGRVNLKTIPTILAACGVVVYFLLFFGWRSEVRQFHPVLFFLIPASSVIFALAWRSFHSAAWKIWALENVQDVHRLYQVALANGMIFERGSWLNKLEFKNADQRRQLASLEVRLDQPRQMEQPASFGSAGGREFGYSFRSIALQMIGILPVIGVIYFVTGKFQFFPLGVFIIILAGIMLFQWVPLLGKPAPIRFNDTALTIKENPPVAWRNITNIYLKKKQHGKNSITMLVVETNTNSPEITLDIANIDEKDDEIEQVLYDYWVRGLQQKS